MQPLNDLWQAMGRPEAWVAGGWVRDRLLGRDSHDLDLVVRGDLDAAAECARGAARLLGVRPHLLGRPPRSVWRLDHPLGTGVEIWALDHLTLDDDARRRDFTCNALFWSLPGGPVVDLVGGCRDLEGRRLRAVRRANLADDPVRLLRGCRFLAQLPSFVLDPITERWMRELAPDLAGAPRERVGKELLSLTRSRAPERGLRTLCDLGLFVPCAPSSSAIEPGWLRDRLAVAARLGSGNGPADEATRRAALLALVIRAWGPPDSRLLHAYAWDRQLLERALTAARMLDRARNAVSSTAADRRQLLADAGHGAEVLLALGSAEAATLGLDRPPWRRLRRQWQRSGRSLDSPPLLTATEVANATGLTPGPQLGEAIRALRRAQIRLEVRSASGARGWLERWSNSGE